MQAKKVVSLFNPGTEQVNGSNIDICCGSILDGLTLCHVAAADPIEMLRQPVKQVMSRTPAAAWFGNVETVIAELQSVDLRSADSNNCVQTR